MPFFPFICIFFHFTYKINKIVYNIFVTKVITFYQEYDIMVHIIEVSGDIDLWRLTSMNESAGYGSDLSIACW